MKPADTTSFISFKIVTKNQNVTKHTTRNNIKKYIKNKLNKKLQSKNFLIFCALAVNIRHNIIGSLILVSNPEYSVNNCA